MGKIKKGVKKFQKKIAGGGVHKKKKLHFRRDKAEAAKAAESHVQSAAAEKNKAGGPDVVILVVAKRCLDCSSNVAMLACWAPELRCAFRAMQCSKAPGA